MTLDMSEVDELENQGRQLMRAFLEATAANLVEHYCDRRPLSSDPDLERRYWIWVGRCIGILYNERPFLYQMFRKEKLTIKECLAPPFDCGKLARLPVSINEQADILRFLKDLRSGGAAEPTAWRYRLIRDMQEPVKIARWQLAVAALAFLATVTFGVLQLILRVA